MLCLATLQFLVAIKAQETRPHQFLRGMSSNLKDRLPVRRLEDSAFAAGPTSAPLTNTSLPVLRKDEVHISGYNMFTRKVTVSWESAVPGLDWEVQVQRWNRYGDEVLASWVVVGSLPEVAENSDDLSQLDLHTKADMQMREVFLDLHRYLYAFRVRAIGSDGAKGGFSDPTDLYGESLGKNVTVPLSTPALQTSALAGKPQAFKLDSGFPVKHHGDQRNVVLKNVKASFELDVHGFATFYNWAHKALPILRRSISKYLNSSASVSIKSGELHLNGSVRKYAVLNVSAIVMPETSGAEYDMQVNGVVESLRDAKLLQVFVSQLIDHDIPVPQGLALNQSSAVSVEEIEFEVDVQSKLLKSERSSDSDSAQTLYFLVGGGVAVLISGLVICFLVQKYRRLSQIAYELDMKKNQHAEVMSDLAKQASTIRHEMEDVQHAREAIHQEMVQAMNPAISIQGVEQDVEAGNAEKLRPNICLPNLLSAAAPNSSVKEIAKN